MKIKKLEETLEKQKSELNELKSICGPVLSRLSLNCENILDLIQAEMVQK